MHTINQLNVHIIAYTIISINVSAVNRPSKRLHVALHKALHEALPKLCMKLYRSSAKALHKPLCKALQKVYQTLYQSLYKSFAHIVNRARSIYRGSKGVSPLSSRL